MVAALLSCITASASKEPLYSPTQLICGFRIAALSLGVTELNSETASFRAVALAGKISDSNDYTRAKIPVSLVTPLSSPQEKGAAAVRLRNTALLFEQGRGVSAWEIVGDRNIRDYFAIVREIANDNFTAESNTRREGALDYCAKASDAVFVTGLVAVAVGWTSYYLGAGNGILTIQDFCMIYGGTVAAFLGGFISYNINPRHDLVDFHRGMETFSPSETSSNLISETDQDWISLTLRSEYLDRLKLQQMEITYYHYISAQDEDPLLQLFRKFQPAEVTWGYDRRSQTLTIWTIPRDLAY